MNSLETRLAAVAATLRARVGLKVNVVVSREVGFDYGIETDQFVIRWGDNFTAGSAWPFTVVRGDTLDQAEAAAVAKIQSQGDAAHRKVERLTKEATELGYILTKKGGAS